MCHHPPAPPPLQKDTGQLAYILVIRTASTVLTYFSTFSDIGSLGLSFSPLGWRIDRAEHRREGAERETDRVIDRQDRRQAVWKRERTGNRVWKTGRTGDRQSGIQTGQEAGSLEDKQDRR
jgi:hypothetical protein